MQVDVGHCFPEREFTVERRQVEEFVTALGVDPADGYQARDGAPVPPGFMVYVTTYGSDEIHEALEIPWQRALFGGTEYEFLAPVTIGETVTVRPVLSDVSERSGSQGTLTFYQLTCEYCRSDGTVALRERSTTIKRG